MAISQFFASWHPALVHFPIGLLFVAVFFEFWAYFRNDERAAWTGRILVTLATVGMLFSFITGNYAEICAARGQIPQDPMGRHEAFATATSWLFIGLVAFRSCITLAKRNLFRVYLVLCLAGLGLLTLTGYQGGQLVYKYAAGVQGVKPPVPPTAQDVANLTLENSEDELKYSDMMHHVFGWITLWLALWLAYQHFNLPHVDRVRAFGPVLMVGGGVFLMIFSDWNSWPLSNQLPITDPEVLFHKILATIMIFIGIGMNAARRKDTGDVGSLQAHLLAVLALIGGGMLFTHVHTGAPYSDTAIGVYIQHFVIGCLALACGTVKMLELVRPTRKRLWDLLWIVLLVVVAFNLITYREGFPWYAPVDRLPLL